MNNGRYQIIESPIGLVISESRVTVYDVMEGLECGDGIYMISKTYNISPRQVKTAIEYIEKHRERLEPKLKQILKKAAEYERYHRARAAEIEQEIAKQPMTPRRAKLKALLERSRRIRGERRASFGTARFLRRGDVECAPFSPPMLGGKKGGRDHNCEGQAEELFNVLEYDGDWLKLVPMELRWFRDVGLSDKASDETVWRFSQEHNYILPPYNRRADDKEKSLELVTRRLVTSSSLPVVTISNLRRVISDPVYRRRCAERLAEIVDELDRYRGTPRLFVP